MSDIKKQPTQEEFEKKTNEFWASPPDCYGSIQNGANSAKRYFELQGMDATEQYEVMRKRMGRQFSYAGD